MMWVFRAVMTLHTDGQPVFASQELDGTVCLSEAVKQVSSAGYGVTLAQGHGSKPHLDKRASGHHAALTIGLASKQHPFQEESCPPGYGERGMEIQGKDNSRVQWEGHMVTFHRSTVSGITNK